MRKIWRSVLFIIPIIRRRVVCGRGEIIDSLKSSKPFKSVDFPTFGLPRIDIYPDLYNLDSGIIAISGLVDTVRRRYLLVGDVLYK